MIRHVVNTSSEYVACNRFDVLQRAATSIPKGRSSIRFLIRCTSLDAVFSHDMNVKALSEAVGALEAANYPVGIFFDKQNDSVHLSPAGNGILINLQWIAEGGPDGRQVQTQS
jgi:hypothetical protein